MKMLSTEPTKQESLEAIGHVISYLAGRWYETEYGQVEFSERVYGPALAFMEKHSWEVARG